jgi:hypothetical protein
MLTYDLISLSRIKHEEMIADAEKWSGRAYGFYPEVPEQGANRIVAALNSLKAMFARKPAVSMSSGRSLRAATK